MADRFRLTLAQLDPTVGDIDGNAAQARTAWQAARDAGADMLALPEMFITGYDCQDLVRKPVFHQAALAAVEALAADCADAPAIGIGGPWMEGARLYNAWFILSGGRIARVVRKHHLPNDGIFDEARVFSPADPGGPYAIGPLRIGTPVCEDAWHDDVTETLEETGAEMLLVPNGSPYSRNRLDMRQAMMVARVVETGLPLVYLNMVGGQDDQIFDGASFVLNPGGALAVQMPPFEAGLAHVDFTRTDAGWRAEPAALAHVPDSHEQDYRAMVEALRGYCRKTGFDRVLLGLSGGIDSALVAAIAVDALGAGNVRCVMLPSDYTTAASLEDAQALAATLGVRYDTLPIGPANAAVDETLKPLFAGHVPDVTEENIQSRLRGLLLMALSNKFGEMLLTTGNKSEVAVGYATLYGDMAGGYNPIKDLYKTRVFALARWRNGAHRDWMAGPAGTVIPPRIIDKAPSAELRHDQKDADSLPPYDELDAILEMLVDRDASAADCVAAGHDRDTVSKVEQLLYTSEYKRFQAAPGTRLSLHAFWRDRRYPIVNRWRDRS